MARPKKELLSMLKEQMELLRTSLDAFYEGEFAESLRIATILRILVHETGASKPLLKQIRPDGLELPILEHVGEVKPSQEEFMRFAVSVRLGPGPAIAPAVDLGSAHNYLSSIGPWWNRTTFRFPSMVATEVAYTRRQVVLILVNREGGAHVDPNEDRDYVRLRTDVPLQFEFDGVPIETPELARFLVAQSGVEMMYCLGRNFFPDFEVPSKWEYGEPPPVAIYQDQISLSLVRVAPAFPRSEVKVMKRG